MKMPLRSCWPSSVTPAPDDRLRRPDGGDEAEAPLAVHGDDPDGLADVVAGRELEGPEGRLDAGLLHGRLQLGAVAGDVGEGEVGPLGGVGQDEHARVRLGGKLVW